MSLDVEQEPQPSESYEARRQFRIFALCCLAILVLFLVIEIAAGGYVSGTNALSYYTVNAARGFLPWPAVILGCTSSRWSVRLPSLCIALFLAFGVWFNSTWGNSFNYSAEISQYELLSMKMLDRRTAIAKYRFSPGAFSPFYEITRKEIMLGPGLIFVQVISNTRE